MKLVSLRISGFQCFGLDPTAIEFNDMTYLLGPNGSGKTAVLQALARLFGFNPSLRRVLREDFHVLPGDEPDKDNPPTLWIEADFEFPESKDPKGKHAPIPAFFAHMLLESAEALPRVRFRLDASMDLDGEIEETLSFVCKADENGEPLVKVLVPRGSRNAIHVHYLPARRDPSDHVSYTASSLLGRLLRSADWKTEREQVRELTAEIGMALETNEAIEEVNDKLEEKWSSLYTGQYFQEPIVSFERNEIESLLRHLTVAFTPGHDDVKVDFTRLSDGQQSLLYVALVLANQAISLGVLDGDVTGFDIDKLRPPVFTLIAMEEPENSLSPHYLGRVIKALTDFSQGYSAQAVVATHAPSLLKRVPPEWIRYLRLDENRKTVVKTILMPAKEKEAYKFVREAVQAFPELYFSRLAILGEGDSEEIVVPRLMQALGLDADQASVVVVPLGGRHVNHFWRLLQALGIPHVTLLDLDLARHHGGWGRVRYVCKQLLRFPEAKGDIEKEDVDALPEWDGDDDIIDSDNGKEWRAKLEKLGVFFSSPLDLDFAMLKAFPEAYGVEPAEEAPLGDEIQVSVLGKSNAGIAHYYKNEVALFSAYHRLFNVGAKPGAHLMALAGLTNKELKKSVPGEYSRMLNLVKSKLDSLPE